MVARIYTDTVTFEAPERETWMDVASCTQVDPNMFFPEKGNTSVKVADAKKICLTKCSVRIQCLARALADEKGSSRRFGVFGGMSPTERERLQEALDKMKEDES